MVDESRRLSELPVWLPYTQMATAPYPFEIARASGSKLWTTDGQELIDAISSWWVTLHGHCHPHIARAIQLQSGELDQVILAGCLNSQAVRLAERLIDLLPGSPQKIFFSDNGSTAVEVGLKMALQYWFNQGEDRTSIIVLEGAYHGETAGAMSLGGFESPYSQPFASMMFPVHRVTAPVAGKEQRAKEDLLAILRHTKPAAIIYEPILQAAGGMRVYSAEAMSDLLSICHQHGVLCIADEVAVGFGRLGRWFGSDYLAEPPDIICLSKGLSGGTMPLGATSATEEIFRQFLHEDRSKMFLHGHSFCGNAIGCAAANASLDLMQVGETWSAIEEIARLHADFIPHLQDLPAVKNPRVIGTILAFDLDVANGGKGYYAALRDQLYRQFTERGVLLRPLGNVVYVLPPYCISEDELHSVYSTLEAVISHLKIP